MNWINVNEAKPNVGQKVLVVQNPKTTATREPLFAIYNGKDFIPPQPTIYANLEVGYSKWSDITHWMPLPEIPSFHKENTIMEKLSTLHFLPLNQDQKDLIISIINHFGAGQHPVCDNTTIDGFMVSYLKDIIDSKKFKKSISNLSEKGKKILAEIKEIL